ncbi:MAG: hypothetical protein ABI462_09080 [Ignavibacteria bacterium]
MKYIKVYSVLAIVFFYTAICYSQTQPSLQLSFGLAFPGKDFGGELVTTNDSGITFINSDFIKKNYATTTGASVAGTLKFPIEKRGIISAVMTGAYTYFNAFKKSSLGATIENNISVPVSFDNRFSTSTFGLGIEASPFSNSKISPYVNGSLTLNILSLSVSKNDFTTIVFNDAFRMGLLFNAGINYKMSDEYSLSFGGSYHMSNLFLKTHKESFADRIEFNRESIPINDEEGSFYSNLSDPSSVPFLVEGTNKNVNWWNLNIGLNIRLGKSKK